MDVAVQLADELSLKEEQIRGALDLLSNHTGISFIARFRKELTGALDENQVRLIRDRAAALHALEEQKQKLLQSMEGRGALSDELRATIDACRSALELEDISLSFKRRRRSRAVQARKLGLEPLATVLFAQDESCAQVEDLALSFVDPARGIADVGAALAGASDIIGEWVAYDPKVRSWARNLYLTEGVILATSRRKPGGRRGRYAAYQDLSHPIHSLPPHVTLALHRGEKDRALRVDIGVPEEKVLGHLAAQIIRDPDSPYAPFLGQTLAKAHERLIHPSISAQVRALKKDEADEGVIDVLARNLRELLLSPPAGRRTVMAIDPGLRMGCNVAVVNAAGQPVAHRIPHPPTQRNGPHQGDAVASASGARSRGRRDWQRDGLT